MKLFNYVRVDPSTNTQSLNSWKMVRHFFGLILLLIVFFGSWTVVDEGDAKVVLRFGNVTRIMSPGLNFKLPLVEDAVKFEVKTRKIEVEASASSNDLQTVTTNIAMQYSLVPENVGLLYGEVGTNYRSRIIDPAIQDAVKATTALFNAEELITRRTEVREAININLKDRLKEAHILVKNVDIVNFSFSESFDNAIEQKVTAEQDALREENRLKQIEFEAQQKIATARAEAEAIRIQAQAITQQGGRDFVNLQWVEAWREGGAQVPTTVIGEGSGNFLFNLK